MPSQAEYTEPLTRPDKPKLVTPFDELPVDKAGRPIRDVETWRRKREDILRPFNDTLGESPDHKPPLEPELPAGDGRVCSGNPGCGIGVVIDVYELK